MKPLQSATFSDGGNRSPSEDCLSVCDVEEEKKSNDKQSRKICFTDWTPEEEHIAKLIHIFEDKGWDYIFGLEECPTTGKLHLQGFVRYKNPIRLGTLRRIIGKSNGWTKVAKGQPYDNVKYCWKDNRYWMKGIEPIKYVEMPTIMKIDDMYPWQSQLLGMLSTEPNDRDVIWVFCEHGCSGKTAFSKYCAWHKLAVLIRSGKSADIKHMIAKEKNSRDFIIDLTRANEEFVSYTLIEELKDGIIYSGKYEGCSKFITTPHIIVMSNGLPDRSKLSADRWKVFHLQDNRLKEMDEPWWRAMKLAAMKGKI